MGGGYGGWLWGTMGGLWGTMWWLWGTEASHSVVCLHIRCLERRWGSGGVVMGHYEVAMGGLWGTEAFHSVVCPHIRCLWGGMWGSHGAAMGYL